MSRVKIIEALLLSVVVLIIMYFGISRGIRVIIGYALVDAAVTYEQEAPEATRSFAFVGDSTVVGVGASAPEETIAGRFGSAYPDADIESVGETGLKMHEVPGKLDQLERERYDLLVLQVGGNDILRATELEDLEEDTRAVVAEAKDRADTVVLMHGGDIGLAPFIPKPLDYYWTWRTVSARKVFHGVADGAGIIYIDGFKKSLEDDIRANPSHWFAPDGIHPSDASYQVGYELILEEFERRNVQL